MEEMTQETTIQATEEVQETKTEVAVQNSCRKQKLKVILLVVAAVILFGCLFGNCWRKYDYAVMFSENAVVTLNEIKQGGWDIINARWASDARGVWNYEFIVRRPAPLFGIFGRKLPKEQSAPAPQVRRSAPAPKPQAQPEEAPKK